MRLSPRSESQDSSKNRSPLPVGKALLTLLALCVVTGHGKSGFVNNYLKNYDSLNYMWMDCNGDLFDIMKAQSQFSTVFVSMCRMLPSALFRSNEIPLDVETMPCNVFVKSYTKKVYSYHFLNFTSSNGFEFNEDASKVKVYWSLDDGIEFTLEISATQIVDNIEKTLKEEIVSSGPSLGRSIVGYNYKLSFPQKNNWTRAEGIYDSSWLSWAIRGGLNILMTIPLLLPAHFLKTSRGNIHVASYLFLSSQLVADVMISYFGEKVSTANLISILLISVLVTVSHLSPEIKKKLELKRTAKMAFIVTGFINFSVYTVFYLQTRFANQSYFIPIVVLLLITLGQRLAFKCLKNKTLYDSLFIVLFATIFTVLRIIQINNSFRGMLSRTFGTPIKGIYADSVNNSSAWFSLATLTQILYVFMISKCPPTMGELSYDEEIDEITVNNITTKADNKL